MDAGRAVELSIRAAQNPYYETALSTVAGGIRKNRQFHESFADAGVFPSDFIQQLEAAELAGVTTESLLRLAKEYEDRARTSVKIITGIATAVVWILAAMIMIYFIFTLFYHVYYKPIQDAIKMTEPGAF
jgi:type II secretory pathway component PulF